MCPEVGRLGIDRRMYTVADGTLKLPNLRYQDWHTDNRDECADNRDVGL